MKPSDPSAEPINHRILIIDDNPAIHEDFKRVLVGDDSPETESMEEDEFELFGGERPSARQAAFKVDSAFQGQEGLEKIRAAEAAGQPYAMAFVDVRMPPGWDGIETILNVWKEFPDMQMVICTAYSDYSWDQMTEAVGATDSMLILKKPFDCVEALQIAHALTRKWQLTRAARRQMSELDALVGQRTAELQRSEERFAKAFQASPMAMSIQNCTTGKLVDVNSSFEELFGYSRNELLEADMPPRELWVDPSTPISIRKELTQHQAVRGTAALIRTKTGETRDTLVSAEQFTLESEPHLLLILQDITERARIEQQLRQAQKMEAVGQLAAGIAHDFNNLLTVILGNISLQLGTPGLDEKLAGSLRQVARASERASALTRQLLAYSRKQIIQRRPLDLSESVTNSIQMLRRIIGEHIAVDASLTPDLPAIHADPTSVDQIIMNLALNARDAMPDGGQLTLSSELCTFGPDDVSHHPDASEGSFVCLCVRDTGCGMDEATLKRLFEPFFTTKEQGKGTGMGLATVYGIAQQHDGWVDVESRPGCGATFRVYFPISHGAASVDLADTSPAKVQLAPKRVGSILVVEDEEMLREFVKTVLESLGYRVLTARNGVEALNLWETEGGNVELLFTDVVMPESISGWQLAHRLRQRKGDLKVIFTSGYSTELLSEEFEQRGGEHFLPKPFLTETLTQTVSACLREAPGGSAFVSA
ncbi:MAG TPA: response regulator [Chthoniobacteraceae bacterium]|jgi:PAS domain S-box-containing protein|nr:response regulator [Chthoniobacteraceae bacterium]